MQYFFATKKYLKKIKKMLTSVITYDIITV
nr:MAG TPA: hypothetical protein [Caudoviricetes sp.]